METSRRNPLRLLAPLALVAAGVALVIVISGASGGSGGSGGSSSNSAEKARDLGTPASQKTTRRHSRSSSKLPDSVYIVKSGDTLGAIAQRTGVPVSRLQELNPGLDQFSLVSGQRIKLR
jgi:LysM repeat protein